MRPYFRDVAIHVNRLLEDLTALREMADHAIEIGLLLESSRQSVTQRKFAAWAAILAFPTAVAGIYGMNFQNMPELTWLFYTNVAYSAKPARPWATKRIIHSATVWP